MGRTERRKTRNLERSTTMGTRQCFISYISTWSRTNCFPPKLTDKIGGEKVTETFLVAVLIEILAKDRTKPFLKHNERILGREVLSW